MQNKDEEKKNEIQNTGEDEEQENETKKGKKTEQDKTDQLTKFYGAANCSHTKTMTKQMIFPEFDAKSTEKVQEIKAIKEEDEEEQSMEEPITSSKMMRSKIREEY